MPLLSQFWHTFGMIFQLKCQLFRHIFLDRFFDCFSMELWQILVQKWTLEQPLMHPKIVPKLWFCRGCPIWGPSIVFSRFLWHSGRHLVPFWLHFGCDLGPFWLRLWPFHDHLTGFFLWPISHAILIYLYCSSDHFYVNCRCIVRFSSCKSIHSSGMVFKCLSDRGRIHFGCSFVTF